MSHKNPPKILFYCQALLGKKTGVGYYNEVLLDQLLAIKKDEEITLVYFESLFSREQTNYLKNKYPDIALKAHRVMPRKLAQKLVGTTFEPTTKLLWTLDSDAVIYPNFYGFKCVKNTKFIISIPDIAYLLHPEVLPEGRKGLLGRLFPSGPDFLKRATLKQALEADIILTISNSVKSELVEFLNVDTEKVVVTTVAPASLKTTAASLDEIVLPKKYFLFVGTIEPRKNLEVLLDAYSNLSQAIRKDYSLVLCGGVGWKSESILNKVERLKNQGLDIVLTGYISDEAKSQVYKNAKLYIQPSIYEGLGMPILEAMSFSIPVICSDIPVFKEFAYDSATFFKKDSYQDLVKAIINVLENKQESQVKIKAGKTFVENYRADYSGVEKLLSIIRSEDI